MRKPGELAVDDDVDLARLAGGRGLVPSAKPKPLFWKALPNQTSGSPPEKMPTPPVSFEREKTLKSSKS